MLVNPNEIPQTLKTVQNTVIIFSKWTFVIGKAGAGKIMVIKVIRKRYTLLLCLGAIMILALTGAIAINVKGKAIHSAQKVPT